MTSADLLETGATLADYRIEGVIGAGGMGIVYEATQLALNRKVALKIVAAHLSEDEAFRERFRREGLVQASLDHPRIVPIYEAGDSGGRLFLAMRLVRGPKLKTLIADGTLTPARTIHILAQVADALDAAHAAGLIHRDIKPQNVLLGDHDIAYLADFGLVKSAGDLSLTGSGDWLGTPLYLSPEQIRGEPATERSDVYALGAVLWECLAGVSPYRRESESALLFAHLFEPVPRVTEKRPELPPAVDHVVAKAMAKDPGDRYASAGELVAAAAAALGAPAVDDTRSLPRLPIAAIPTRRIGRRRHLALGAALLGAAIAGLLVGRTSAEIGEAAPRLAAAGPLQLSYPGPWQPVADAPAIPGPELLSSIALGRPGSAWLVAGLASTMPSSAPQPVRLGDNDALRYRSGTTRVYTVPTSAGVATIACIAPGEAARASCEHVASTASLPGVATYSLARARRYGNNLDVAIGALNVARIAERSRLEAAAAQPGQAKAASRLARAYARALRDLRRAKLDPVLAVEQKDVISALETAARAYARIAAAAEAGERSTYERAAAAVRRAERRLTLALQALEAFGYTIN